MNGAICRPSRAALAAPRRCGRTCLCRHRRSGIRVPSVTGSCPGSKRTSRRGAVGRQPACLCPACPARPAVGLVSSVLESSPTSRGTAQSPAALQACHNDWRIPLVCWNAGLNAHQLASPTRTSSNHILAAVDVRPKFPASVVFATPCAACAQAADRRHGRSVRPPNTAREGPLYPPVRCGGGVSAWHDR